MLRALSARQCARSCIVEHRGLARVRRRPTPQPQSPDDDEFADLTLPHQWYPAARRMQRKLIAHIGPTNSGKPYAAIQALKGSMQSVYCAPLRLLAWEVHSKLNAEGHSCNLVTGQELVTLDDAGHTSCTVEMCDLSLMYDVAVLDEAQLLGDPSRGWAWTRALLGLQAREIHLCGSETMIPLLEVILDLSTSNSIVPLKRIAVQLFSAPVLEASAIADSKHPRAALHYAKPTEACSRA
jgi:hypothetical protein